MKEEEKGKRKNKTRSLSFPFTPAEKRMARKLLKESKKEKELKRMKEE